MSKELLIEHGAEMAKTAINGVAIGGGTYVAGHVFDVAAATQYAGLAAASATAFYFGVMGLKTLWLWIVKGE